MIRGCDVCGTRDELPRHVHDAGAGVVLTRHLACCAAAGCPSGTCTTTDKEED